jgi:hypothetical protein
MGSKGLQVTAQNLPLSPADIEKAFDFPVSGRDRNSETCFVN